MPTTTPKKNSNAVALGKLSRASRTPAQLREHALTMVRARRKLRVDLETLKRKSDAKRGKRS